MPYNDKPFRDYNTVEKKFNNGRIKRTGGVDRHVCQYGKQWCPMAV